MARRRGPSVEDLVAQGVTLVRSYSRVETSKTEILKDLAGVVVDLRARFHTEDGRTDWAGRSHPYRETVARIYSDAGLPPDSMDGLQAALRYHVGNVLRQVAPAEELEDLGLKSATPKDRVKATRDRTAALARAAVAQQATGNVRADVARLVTGADVLLAKVEEADLAALPEDRLVAMEAALTNLQARASELLAIVQGSRTGAPRGRRRSLKAV